MRCRRTTKTMAKAKKAKKAAVIPAADTAKKEQAGFDKAKIYPIAEAVEWVKKLSKEKFDASVEVHMRLGIDPRKGEQQIRTAVSLPHGTGKTVKVAAFVSPEKIKEVKEAGADIVGGEELIAEIKNTEKTDFEVAVAEPAMMKNLSQIAKILGTRGLMPSPKNETVTPNPAKAVAELKNGNVHVAIGKVSFDPVKLTENFDTIIETIKKIKPAKVKGIYIHSITITSSMGPGIKVQA